MNNTLKKAIFATSLAATISAIGFPTAGFADDWEPQGTVTRGKADLFDIVAIHRPGPQSIDTEYVTALKRDDNGKLQLNLWHETNITGNQLESGGQVILGPIGNDLELDWFVNTNNSLDSGDRRFAVAMIDGQEKLRIILWSLSWHNGTFGLTDASRLGDNVASGFETGKIKEVSLAVMNDTRFVTAVKTNNGRLKLTVWDVNADGMDIQRRGSWTSAGDAEKIHISAIEGNRAIVAFQNENDNLEVMSFSVNGQGQLTKDGEAVRGRVSELDHHGLTTAMRDDDGKLRLIKWQIGGNGGISRVTDNFAEGHPTGAVTKIGLNRMLSVMKDGSSSLRLIEWSNNLARNGGGTAYSVNGPVKIARGYNTGHAVTAALDSNDRLRLTVWQR